MLPQIKEERGRGHQEKGAVPSLTPSPRAWGIYKQQKWVVHGINYKEIFRHLNPGKVMLTRFHAPYICALQQDKKRESCHTHHKSSLEKFPPLHRELSGARLACSHTFLLVTFALLQCKFNHQTTHAQAYSSGLSIRL